MRRLAPWIVILLIVGIAAYAMAGDLGKIGDRLAGFSWIAFVAALARALANYAIRFLRWQLYLRHQQVDVPVGSSALVFGAGLSLSITPAKLGELVKSYLLRELHDIPAPRTAPVVVAERVTDLIALLSLAVVGVATYGVDTTFVIAAAALIGCGLVLLAWPRPTRWIVDVITRPAKLRKLRDPLLETYAGLVELCRPRLLLMATAIALPAWGCECVGFALIVNAFPGAHVDLGLAIVIYASTTIAGALSFLPGGLGVTEGAMIVLLIHNATGVDRATALDATILTRLATLWFAVALGLVFLAVARARIARRQSRPST
ncbi:MAG: lysylphosphatidylglycerol synthase transmembrane domain-containing protein [Proteobacteria bacterium]|nr:lysylphosphatidylglycerol synthase transmembrane domain-containing protein [Pseudomonadota bacterium]